MKRFKLKRNFIPYNRDGYILRRHAPLVIKPLFIALGAVLLWKFILFDHHFHFAKHIENPLLFLVMPLIGFVYVIFTSLAVGSVFSEYKAISRSVVKKDVETFLLHRDEQLPILMHLLVGAPSILLVLLTAFFHYEDVWIGMASVFSVIFVVVITWMVVTELDNYEKSVWFKEKIPKDWFEIDIDLFFSKKK
jgi:hypothetical protein